MSKLDNLRVKSLGPINLFLNESCHLITLLHSLNILGWALTGAHMFFWGGILALSLIDSQAA